MPELPEVETTRVGLEPHLTGRRIARVVVRERRLRWPVPAHFEAQLSGQRIVRLDRRAKYLLLRLERGTVLLHLGMSGSLRMVEAAQAPGKHDHLDVEIEGARTLRLTDPRRFGSVHYATEDPDNHPLLAALGPEPLSESFDASALHAALRGRRSSIKETVMNAHIVVGVGNIYASESLFRAGIDPRTRAGRLGRPRCAALVDAIKHTLRDALAAGGSSLRDWHHSDGSPGYFQQQYLAYDRAGQACRRCGATIRAIRQGQRSTYFCPGCQRR